MRRLFAWLIFLVLVNSGGSLAWAQTEPTPPPPGEAGDVSQVSDDEVNRVARQLYCPICENIPLDVCETQACEAWKDEIRRRLAAGQSDQQIVDYFASMYGERALVKPRSWVAWVLSVIDLAVAGDVSQVSDGEVSDDEVNRVARQLYCPICENIPLDVCETQACEDWKDEIRRRLAVGQSDQQIVDYFAGIYGERALAKPRSWVVWALPVIGLAVAAIIFAVLVRDWLGRPPATPAVASQSPVPPPPSSVGLGDEDAEYVARLEREIQERQ